jgi:predicted Holliday junction resolvase-like endonuclease
MFHEYKSVFATASFWAIMVFVLMAAIILVSLAIREAQRLWINQQLWVQRRANEEAMRWEITRAQAIHSLPEHMRGPLPGAEEAARQAEIAKRQEAEREAA